MLHIQAYGEPYMIQFSAETRQNLIKIHEVVSNT
jgi:hypothetical protein